MIAQEKTHQYLRELIKAEGYTGKSRGTLNPENLPTPTPTPRPHSSGGGGVLSSYTVTFKANNGTADTRVKTAKNSAVAEPTAPTREGYTFDGWYTDSKLTEKYDFSAKVTKSFALYAKWTEAAQATAAPQPTAKPTQEPSQNTKQHKAYVIGYKGMFNSDGNITRAETTAILARLTDGFDESGSYKPNFPDATDEFWYYDYIGFEENKAIITGYPYGTFKPENNITRAEFAALITKFTNISEASEEMPFGDTDGHWAEKYIAACYEAGYITGYENNSFKPDNYITRAEAVAIINRVFERNDIKNVENPFTDVNENHWAYTDIMEAAVTHNVN